MIPQEIDFVVPDGLLSAATIALGQHKMLLPCTDGEDCPIVSPKRFTPAPDSHLHIEGTEVPVGLFIQSVTLWFLPPLEVALITPDQGQLPAPYALASDESILPTWRPERGAGVFKPGAHPVVIVRSHVLLEAFMRICARYSHTLAGSFSNSMVLYMSMYVDDDGYLDLKQLPEPLVSSYLAYTTTKISGRQWLAELRQMFGEPALLPEEE
ncbi:hypothetical protein E4U31_000747 [Claviceps sp. LM219 group G6]|nr:hypothetical protein E4U31_000747 [Claviceps sp. LM219 group G6]